METPPWLRLTSLRRRSSREDLVEALEACLAGHRGETVAETLERLEEARRRLRDTVIPEVDVRDYEAEDREREYRESRRGC